MYDLIKDIVTGVVIPTVAVFYGGRISRMVMQKEDNRKEIIQRNKILNLMKRELELCIDFTNEGTLYRTRQLISGNLMLSDSSFDILQDEKLILATLEVIRQYEMLEIAMNYMEKYSSSYMSSTAKPGVMDSLLYGLEKLFNLKTTMDRNVETLMAQTKQVINGAAEQIDVKNKELLVIVNSKLELMKQ